MDIHQRWYISIAYFFWFETIRHVHDSTHHIPTPYHFSSSHIIISFYRESDASALWKSLGMSESWKIKDDSPVWLAKLLRDYGQSFLAVSLRAGKPCIANNAYHQLALPMGPT